MALEVLEAKKGAIGLKDNKIAGCFITANYRGDLVVERGFVRPEDDPKIKKAKVAKQATSSSALWWGADLPVTPDERRLSATTGLAAEGSN